MQGEAEIRDLLGFMADLYALEDRTSARTTVEILKNAAIGPIPKLTAGPCPKQTILDQALAHSPHEDIAKFVNAMPFLHWFEPSEAIENLTDDKAAAMMAVEVIGPDGMIKHPDIRVGVYAQDPNFDYPARKHAAEETYIMIAGEGFWSVNHERPRQKRVGEVIHHPSMIAHQNLTRDIPMVAFWRWSGDISFDHYYQAPKGD